MADFFFWVAVIFAAVVTIPRGVWDHLLVLSPEAETTHTDGSVDGAFS